MKFCYTLTNSKKCYIKLEKPAKVYVKPIKYCAEFDKLLKSYKFKEFTEYPGKISRAREILKKVYESQEMLHKT